MNNRCLDGSPDVAKGHFASGSRPWWLGPLFVFVFSRLSLFAAVLAGLALTPLPGEKSRINYEKVPGNVYEPETYEGVPSLVTALSKWDAYWYESIWRDGYSYEIANTRKYNVNFFPGYPLAVKGALEVTGLAERPRWHYLVAEILSNATLLAGLLLVYRLALALGEDAKTALYATAFFSFQPASVFFSAPYSESLFFLSATATLLAAQKKHWALAGVCGLVCSATRITGVALAPAAGLIWLAGEGVTWRALVSKSECASALALLWRRRSWLWLCLIPCGLFAYMAYLHHNFGDALAFIHSQKQWNVVAKGFWVVIPQSLAEGVMYARPLLKLNLVAFFTILAASIAVWRRYGAGYGVFCLLCILMPTMATMSSMLRYVAAAVPAFILIAHITDRWRIRPAALMLLALGLFYAAYVYTHARFVA